MRKGGRGRLYGGGCGRGVNDDDQQEEEQEEEKEEVIKRDSHSSLHPSPT